MGTPLVRAVFGAVVLATIAAFLITQQLKGEVPVVLRFAASPDAISPNGDGVRDGTRVGFDLSQPAKVTFDVIDDDGNRVRRLLTDRRLGGDQKHRFYWNGRDDGGHVVPDGNYRLRVIRKHEGRILDSIKQIRVDTKPPRVSLLSARPGVISPGPGVRTRVVIRYRGPRNLAPELRIFRTDHGPTRVVFRFRGDEHHRAVWDGYLRGGPAEDGDYAFTVRVRDRAGNEATGPRAIPTAAAARGGTGVAVRHLTLRGPLGVVAAGSPARLEVGPGGRAFEFALSRLGSSGSLRKGKRTGGRFRVRIPRRARTGLYLLRVRAGRRRAVWPLVVAGTQRRRGAERRARPLVVLPVLSWQGENLVDQDLDGFADTLASADSVRLDRPFRDGALPPHFASQVAPLLRFLDRERLPYDLTTDLALARGQGPALASAAGVVLAGSERWLPDGLGRGLRDYVTRGGRLASLGADSLRRRVVVGRDVLRAATGPRPADLFGERIRSSRVAPGPLVPERDAIGLFGGLAGFPGSFSRLDRSLDLPAGARPLVLAGRTPGEPAFVAYRLGRGIVVRVGTAEWASELRGSRADVGVARVTARIWRLLAGSR